MDAAKRNEFIGRLSRALGRDNGACPTSVPDFDYSKGPQETMYSDLSRDQIITMFKEECDRNGTKYVNTTPDKLAKTVIIIYVTDVLLFKNVRQKIVLL